MSKMMRISEKTAKNLMQLAKDTRKSKQIILEKAIELYARDQFLKKANEAYAKLKKNKRAWKEDRKELEAWDITLSDGLSDDEA